MAQAGTQQRRESGQEGHLQQGLKRRHMTMISLGGIIGAGLFVGTGPILVLAIAFLLGLFGPSPGFSNLYAEGGFFPNGPLAMCSPAWRP